MIQKVYFVGIRDYYINKIKEHVKKNNAGSSGEQEKAVKTVRAFERNKRKYLFWCVWFLILGILSIDTPIIVVLDFMLVVYSLFMFWLESNMFKDSLEYLSYSAMNRFLAELHLSTLADFTFEDICEIKDIETVFPEIKSIRMLYNGQGELHKIEDGWELRCDELSGNIKPIIVRDNFDCVVVQNGEFIFSRQDMVKITADEVKDVDIAVIHETEETADENN